MENDTITHTNRTGKHRRRHLFIFKKIAHIKITTIYLKSYLLNIYIVNGLYVVFSSQ